MADTTTTPAGTDWASAITGGLNLAQGLYGLFGGNQSQTQQAMSAADPFATQRPLYQGMLAGLMTNPASFQLSPAAQATMDQGMVNVGRAGAAKGFLGSGNLLSELTKFGQQTAAQDYYQQAGLLAQLAGAGAGSTGTAAQIAANRGAQTGTSLSAIGSGIGGLSQAIPALMKLPDQLGSIGSTISDWWSGLSSSTAPLVDYASQIDYGSLWGNTTAPALDTSLSAITSDLSTGTDYVGSMSDLFGSWY